MGSLEHQDGAAHVVVDLAEKLDQSRLVEHQLSRLLVLVVTAEIEALGLRVREHAVVFVVEVRKRDGGAALDRQEAGRELVVELPHLGAFRGGDRLCADLEVDHRGGGIRASDDAGRLHRVPRVRCGRWRPLRQRHGAFHRGRASRQRGNACQRCDEPDEKRCMSSMPHGLGWRIAVSLIRAIACPAVPVRHAACTSRLAASASSVAGRETPTAAAPGSARGAPRRNRGAPPRRAARWRRRTL